MNKTGGSKPKTTPCPQGHEFNEENFTVMRGKPKCKVCHRLDAQRRRFAASDFINELKRFPCTDCGNTFPPVAMDFDHLGDKLFDIAHMSRRNASKKRILAEVAKCELVCANCHRVRTYERLEKSRQTSQISH